MKNPFEQFEHFDRVAKELKEQKESGKKINDYKGQVDLTVNKYHPTKIKYRVNDVFSKDSTTKTIRVEGIDGYLPPFMAGQFVLFSLTEDDKKITKAIYIYSSPELRHHLGFYDFVIRKGFDAVSDRLFEATVGDELESSGPFGEFVYHPAYQGQNLVFIANDNNISPISSIVRDQVDQNKDTNITVFVQSQKIDSELAKLDNETNVKIHFISQLLSNNLIQRYIANPTVNYFFIVGDREEVTDWKEKIQELGVKSTKIRVETPYLSVKKLTKLI